MTPQRFRTWCWLHKWSSLLCTIFLLVVFATGLPLVLKEEIYDWFDDEPPYADVSPDLPKPSLDEMAAASRRLYPDEIITSIFVDDDEPKVVVWMAPSWQAMRADPRARHWIKFDARTGALLRQATSSGNRPLAFLQFVAGLHKDLFAGLPGSLFLAVMAALFMCATVSGVVLYATFMRKLPFGIVRTQRSRRLKWLDLHNLMGAATIVWVIVVGFTGLVNELAKPLAALWMQTGVRTVLEPFKDRPIPSVSSLSSPQSAFDRARDASPGMVVTTVVYPGAEYGSPWHYVLWARGKDALTSRLFNPVLVDASSGALSGAVEMPWYLRVLELSRPLHFGDYGGTPMKVIWVLFDLVAIGVLISGLYLWGSRRNTAASWPEAAVAESEDALVDAIGTGR